MNKSSIKSLIAAILLSIAPLCVAAAGPTWETIDMPARELQLAEQEAEIEITTGHGEVHIIVTKPVTVKVFTILGQLISQETLKPGAHRLRLPSRGIYILRAGSVTRRITL